MKAKYLSIMLKIAIPPLFLLKYLIWFSMNSRNGRTLRDTRLGTAASLVKLSAVNVAVSTVAKCGTLTASTEGLYGSVIISLGIRRNVVLPSFTRKKSKRLFLEAFSNLLDNKEEILQEYEAIIQALTDTSGLDEESTKLQSECEVVAELIHKCVEENAHSALEQQEYQQRYTSLVERYEVTKDRLKGIDDKRLECNAKRESIGVFIRELEQRDVLMDEFDEGLWVTTVDGVMVHSEHEITFTFKDGLELSWKM